MGTVGVTELEAQINLYFLISSYSTQIEVPQLQRDFKEVDKSKFSLKILAEKNVLKENAKLKFHK